MFKKRHQFSALRFLEEGLLIGSQILLRNSLPAIGLLPHNFRSSFMTKRLRRLVGVHAKLFAGSASDLKDREASPSVASGLPLGAIVVEDVHRAVKAFYDSDPSWI